MERLCDSFKNSRQFSTSSKLLKAERSFVRFLELYSYNIFISNGQEIDTDNKVWHVVLVDPDKIEQFLEDGKTGFIDVANYGRLIISGYEDVPEKIKDVSKAIINSSEFFKMTLHPESNDEILYMFFTDSGAKQEIMDARTIEEIEDHGTILYVASFFEPPESVSFNILKRLYRVMGKPDNFESKLILTLWNTFDENCTGVNSIDESGSTLLHQASYWSNKSFVRSLVRKGANIHKKDAICKRLPVHLAALQGDIGLLEYYLKNEISVNETDDSGWTLLHYAVWNNNLQAIRFLIRNGSKIDVKDKCLGKTALHVGAEQDHTEAVELLLDEGAFIDEVDDSGRTPLHYSSIADCLKTAKCLVKRGANIHIVNKNGNEPIHFAVQRGNKDVVEFLLSVGSHINNQNNFGFSPLHIATDSGCLHILRLLVDQGADVTCVSKDGLTPFDCGKDHMDVASFLAIRMIAMFRSQGNIEDALNVCHELLNIHGDHLDSDQTEILDSIFKLIELLYEQRQYSKAFDVLKKIDGKILIPDNYVVLRSICELQLPTIG